MRFESHFSKRMWVQMALVLAFLVALPLMFLGWLLIGTSQTAVKTSVLRDQRQLAIRVASELGEFIRRPQDLLKSTASILGTLHSDYWKQETALVELALNQEIFGRISSLDLTGKERVTSDVGTALKEWGSDPAFQAASMGEFYISSIQFFSDHSPYIVMAVPIKNMGKIKGVLAAEVRLRGFWEIVDAIRIGKTGRACVISKNGVLIADEDKKKVLANQNLSSYAPAKAVLEGKTGSLESKDEEGKAWLEAYSSIAGLGWGVIIRQPMNEAYSFLTVMKVEAWILIILSLVVAIGSSSLLARMMTSSIQELAEKMGKVSQGDFDQRMSIQRQDEIGELMNSFNQMTEKLKKARESEKLVAIGKAATAITHELKNSLMMISTFIGLLPKRHGDKEFLDKFLSMMPRELESWKDMLNEISNFSKRSGFELFETNMNDFISDFIFLVQQKLTQNGITFQCDVIDNLPFIQANSAKLKQALLNLVINAVDAMPQGGEITIWTKIYSKELEIGIRDTGKGIPSDKLPSIFDPFYTTKTSGLGLGLAVCKENIEHHGGSISVQSREGAGTTFFIRLPLAINAVSNKLIAMVNA